jgi:glycosyltransferase involved in cell wall biosynthesis
VRRAPWVLVTGGVHNAGGMDRANAALVSYLCNRKTPVDLITHRVDARVIRNAAINTFLVGRPLSSFFMAQRNLRFVGMRVARETVRRCPDARVVVNGGNCEWPDINWVHCLHRNWELVDGGAPMWIRVKNRLEKQIARKNELRALRSARYIVCNSKNTYSAIIELLGSRSQYVKTIYLGADCKWKTAFERKEPARAWLGIPTDRPLVTFIGALGYDCNKGFDTLWDAWRRLCARPEWDADLVVAGGGRALSVWRRALERPEIADRIRFLGHTDKIGEVLAAADLLVSPVRYESYGLNVQEALCYGVPAIVSACAGVAERYFPECNDLLLPDPEDARDLARRMLRWRPNIEDTKRRIEPMAQMLRDHTWNDMAREIVEFVESPGDFEGAQPPYRI